MLTGSREGVVAVSSVSSGLVVRVIQDHRGAPITDLCVARRPIQVRERERERETMLSCSSWYQWGGVRGCGCGPVPVVTGG